MIKIAKDTLLESQDRQIKYANQHRRYLKFNIRDKVLLSTRNINNSVDKNRLTRKLSPKFIRPYSIISVISDTVYKLDLPYSLKIHSVFYISLLKLYNESPSDLTRTTLPLAIFIPETKSLEYEVENILDKRIMRKKLQYLVK